MDKQFKMLMIVSAIGVAACAPKKPPIEAMTRADMTVKRVQQTNAVEAAPLEMKIAHEKLEQAKKDMDAKNYDSAKRNAEMATINAELAESKTNLQDTKSKTTQAQEGLKTLEKEIKHSDQKGAL